MLNFAHLCVKDREVHVGMNCYLLETVDWYATMLEDAFCGHGKNVRLFE